MNDTIKEDEDIVKHATSDSTSWGKEIVALLTEDQDMGGWDKVDISDPESWVHDLRRQNKFEINE